MAKIFGQLENAQIHNKTSDPASQAAGIAIWRTDTNLLKVATGSGSTYKTMVDLDSTQTLTTKTLTSPVLTTPTTDTHFLTDQGSTPATPSSGTTKFYSKTDGKLYKITSAGVEQEVGASASGGQVNFLSSNPDFENVTTGWSTYADAAAATPVDGTGGSPTVTLTRTTSSPLYGSASGLITKDAANRQGEGVNFAFTVSPSHQAKAVSISFDYIVASGTFAAGTSSADGDLVCYIYDVTNSTLIQPAGYRLIASSTSIATRHVCTFQTSATGTSYRLILHVATTSASAFTVKIDQFLVTPQTFNFSAPVTDWVSFTPTGSWVSNTTYTGAWSRDGDSMKLVYNLALAGAPTSTSLTVNLPSGYSIDTTKFPGATAGNRPVLGTARITAAGVTYNGRAVYNSTTSILIQYDLTVTGSNPQPVVPASVTQAAPATFANNDFVVITISEALPISGWSSSLQMSDQTDTRVVAFQASSASGQTLGSTGVDANATFSSVVDTHGGVSSNTYVIPVSGYYFIQAQNSFTANATGKREIRIQKNSSDIAITDQPGSSAAQTTVSASKLVSCVTGDVIRVVLNQTSGGSLATVSDGSQNNISLFRLSGPSAIAAGETVAARYTATAATSIVNGATTIVNFDTKDFDTHGAVTTGSSWKFTAPVSGIYQVSASVAMSNASWGVGNDWSIRLFKTGSLSSILFYYVEQATDANAQPSGSGTALVKLIAGDTVDIRCTNTGTTVNTLTGTNLHVNILRVGN
jgi:hypothetical protein